MGVVGDIRGNGLAEEPRPGFYISYQQRPETGVELAVGRNVFFLVTFQGSAEAVVEPLRQAIWAADPMQPVDEIATLKRVLSERVGPQRFRASLMGVFAVIALTMALAGIYSVIGCLLAEREHEFGIRKAIGASDSHVVGTVLRWGLRLALIGVGLGLATIMVVNRYLANLLFGVTPTDTPTILLSVTGIVLVTLAACLIPAYRATQIDALAALRSGR